jgi:hypothetical protein
VVFLVRAWFWLTHWHCLCQGLLLQAVVLLDQVVDAALVEVTGQQLCVVVWCTKASTAGR